jgi:hypothetical protein
MPFATHGGGISAAAKDFCQSDAPVIQLTAISIVAPIFHHVSDPGLMRVKSRQQGCSGRAASGAVVKLREANSIRGQCIKVWSFDLTSVAAQVGEPHVIRQNDHHVRAGSLGFRLVISESDREQQLESENGQRDQSKEIPGHYLFLSKDNFSAKGDFSANCVLAAFRESIQ